MNRFIESGLIDSSLYRDQTSWLSPRRGEDGKRFLAEVSSILSKRGEFSSQLHTLVASDKLRELIEIDIPVMGLTLDDYRAARQIQALFSKQCWIDLGFNPLLEGVKAFLKAEQKCIETNTRFELNGGSIPMRRILHAARDRLAAVLGPVPSLEALSIRFGPGANTSTKMAQASLSGKLSAHLACSEDLFPFVGEFLSEVPLVAEHHAVKDRSLLPLYSPDPDVNRMMVNVRVDDGKLVFVPKNAKTHRPIVVEPVLNGLFQLGVGSYLKDRLGIVGIDLRDQDRNRRMARKGSIDGSLATIDLSSASDTISWGLVADIVPWPWFELLAKLRTGTFTYDGLSYRLEKFSSMGNGYTFELESAIFFSLAWACVASVGGNASDVSVFGDDIVLPTEATQLFRDVLDLCGFWVNPQKSYWSGPFRESCGADWLDGEDVRPFYIKDEISDRTLYVFHNWLLRRGERELASYVHDWTWEQNRLYGPDGYGDGHLLGSHDLYTRRRDRRRGYCGGCFDTYALRAKRHQKRRSGDWLIPGYSVYARTGAESPTDPYIVRGSEGYVRTSIYTFATTIICG